MNTIEAARAVEALADQLKGNPETFYAAGVIYGLAGSMHMGTTKALLMLTADNSQVDLELIAANKRECR